MKNTNLLLLTGVLCILFVFFGCKKVPAGLKENIEMKDILTG